MPTLQRAPNATEEKKLRQIFLKAETDIINEIGRLRTLGLVDYHAVAALNRVQGILKKMQTDCWEYVPKLIEKQFYVRVPEARAIIEPAEKHIAGYANAEALTADQHAIIDRLVTNLTGEIMEASATAYATLENALLGSPEDTVERRIGLEMVTRMEATGRSTAKTVPEYVKRLLAEGVTAYIDKAGRHWSLHTYCTMVCRTTSRQAETLAVLTADTEHDLYKISSHGTTCKICAPLEGRVYSKSGNDPDFPPLAAAFGKVDIDGPDTLANSYLNIHPNCLHQVMPWTADDLDEDEVQRTKDFSSFTKNPPIFDPRTAKQASMYRAKEQARADWLNDYRQWERYKMVLGSKIPSFDTFQTHKMGDDDKYKQWQKDYRDAGTKA